MRLAWLASAFVVLASLPGVAAVAVGDASPTVILPDQNGRLVDLALNYGKRYVALAFYPKDGTSGCTREAQNISQALAELTESGIAVYGVSVQDVASKKAFCDQNALQQTMLSDTDKTVCEAFGTLNEAGLSDRVTVILDPSLTVRVIDREVKVEQHAADLIAAVAQLRADDAATALATLKADRTWVAGTVGLRLPEGWTQRGMDYVDPANPQVALRMNYEDAGEGGEVWITARAKGAGVRAVRAMPFAEGDVRQYEFGPGPDGLARSGVVWFNDGQAIWLEGTAPADRAGPLARLVAEVVGSVTW